MAYDTMTQSAQHLLCKSQIHGHPTRQDYELLKKEASNLASEVNNIRM